MHSGPPLREARKRPKADETAINLEVEMTESLVGLGHFVDVIFPLHRRAGVVARIYEFHRETLGHRHALFLARILDDPTNGQSLCTFRVDLARYL